MLLEYCSGKITLAVDGPDRYDTGRLLPAAPGPSVTTCTEAGIVVLAVLALDFHTLLAALKPLILYLRSDDRVGRAAAGEQSAAA